MRNEFGGFYRHEESEFKELWEKAHFVFDANVLLNLYRYQTSTTEQLFTVLEQLKDRIWIPYHVALEYQRNRLNVIGAQNSKFSEVRKAVNSGASSIKTELDKLELKKRHSSIDADDFLKEINSAKDRFLEVLEDLEKDHFSVVNEDHVRIRLDSLFNEKVGKKPDSQKIVDDLNTEAERRFKNKIPPGYMDENKEKSADPVFSYSGISYMRKYSDFLVWNQILEHSKEAGFSDLIFITDDNKEDWWLKVRQNGEKTISPRPELNSEVFLKTDVKRFYMYSSEGFLKHANDMLNIGVSSEAIEEVGDISKYKADPIREREITERLTGTQLKNAARDWILEHLSGQLLPVSMLSIADFEVETDEKKVGYIILFVKSILLAAAKMRRLIKASMKNGDSETFDELEFVLVHISPMQATKTRDYLRHSQLELTTYKEVNKPVKVTIVQTTTFNGLPKFIITDDFRVL